MNTYSLALQAYHRTFQYHLLDKAHFLQSVYCVHFLVHQGRGQHSIVQICYFFFQILSFEKHRTFLKSSDIWDHLAVLTGLALLFDYFPRYQEKFDLQIPISESYNVISLHFLCSFLNQRNSSFYFDFLELALCDLVSLILQSIKLTYFVSKLIDRRAVSIFACDWIIKLSIIFILLQITWNVRLTVVVEIKFTNTLFGVCFLIHNNIEWLVHVFYVFDCSCIVECIIL